MSTAHGSRGMHHADITSALIKAGTNQSAVARSLAGRRGAPLTAAAVHNVIKGRSKSERIALRISQLVAIPVAVLWPGKYPELEARQSHPRIRQEPFMTPHTALVSELYMAATRAESEAAVLRAAHRGRQPPFGVVEDHRSKVLGDMLDAIESALPGLGQRFLQALHPTVDVAEVADAALPETAP